VGGNGTVVRTTNGGITWLQVDCGTLTDLYSVDFIDQLHGWIAGNNGTIRRTTDGGKSWAASCVPVLAACFSIEFVDQFNGWAVGDCGTILRSMDGGATWQRLSEGLTGTLTAVLFSAEATGWICGESGLVLSTTNGGTTWTRDFVGTTNDLSALCIDVAGGVRIAGSGGTLLRHQRHATSASPMDDIQNIGGPARSFLYQNYPNPFNPSTTISYELSRKSNVTITVYSSLGRRVAQLVNGEMDAGYHEVQFDGRNLASGVYFYRMQAGNFMQTHELLLLR
jgi:hypothetical protein